MIGSRFPATADHFLGNRVLYSILKFSLLSTEDQHQQTPYQLELQFKHLLRNVFSEQQGNGFAHVRRERRAELQLLLGGWMLEVQLPRMEALSVDHGAVRFSFSWFNTEAEVDAAVKALAALAEE